MKKLRFLLLLSLVSCGYLHKVKPIKPQHENRIELLQAKYDEKLAALGSEWPSRTDCDALLWAGLSSAAGEHVDLSEAEYASGEMHRRPPPECYPDSSSSTISGDMLLGYMWGLWRNKDLPALQRLADYGEANHWTMGTGLPSRVQMRYNDYVMLAHMIHVLSGGQDVRRYYSATPVYFDVTADYAKHLQALSILLYGEVYGSIDEASLSKLRQLCLESPADALFQSACDIYSGDVAASVSLLLDPNYAAPSYVRGAPAYSTVHWLFAAKIILSHLKGAQ